MTQFETGQFETSAKSVRQTDDQLFIEVSFATFHFELQKLRCYNCGGKRIKLSDLHATEEPTPLIVFKTTCKSCGFSMPHISC